MPFDFYSLLLSGTSSYPMPPVVISQRTTDKYIAYHKATTKLDYISGVVYEDETMWRLIMWANPNYYIEYDIPESAIIRIPMPLNDVLSEVQTFIQNNINR